MSSLLMSFFLLSIVLVHQSQGTMWENFRRNYWERKDSINCYRALTLELFESLKEVVDKFYVEKGQTEFESKIKEKRRLFPGFNQVDSNDDSFKKKKKEAELIAGKGISTIRQWLIHNCTTEKQELVMKFTARFKEGRSKCGDTEYLRTPVMLLEQACPEEKDGVVYGKPTFAHWKSGVHGLNGIDPWDRA